MGVWIVGILFVVFGSLGMFLHKLANVPKLEIFVWAITFWLFMFFEILLHQK